LAIWEELTQEPMQDSSGEPQANDMTTSNLSRSLRSYRMTKCPSNVHSVQYLRQHDDDTR